MVPALQRYYDKTHDFDEGMLKMKKYKVAQSRNRIAEARERTYAWYQGKPDRLPFSFTPSFEKRYTIGEMAVDIDKAIEGSVHDMNEIMAGFPDSDYIPFLNLAYLGEGMIPSMFGAEQFIVRDTPPFTQGRIIRNLKKDLPGLPRRINPDTDGWGPLLKETVLRFLDATDGEVPVMICDIQSPYGIATKLVDNQELMLAMYDTPELVHELMELCVQATIDTIRAMERWAGNPDLVVKNVRAPFPDCGLVIYDDYISVLSPSLHEVFCFPYNMKLYREFGIGHLHTCGPYFPGYIDSVLKHRPRSMDIIILRNISRTREDMLLLKQYAGEAGVKLSGSLSSNPVSIFDSKHDQLPDGEFISRMARGGNLFITSGGKRDFGLELLKIAKSITY